MRIAIAATHPIQYQAAWFRALAARDGVAVRVFYALLPDEEQQGTGFGVPFRWDVPLLDGYPWQELGSRRRRPRLDSFFGNWSRGWKIALEQFRPDALVVTGWNAWPLVQAAAAARALGVPVVVRGDSNAVARRPAWKRLLHRLWLSRYDAFLAVGESNRAFYRQAGVPADKIFAGPHFVDVDRWAREGEGARTKRSALRARWEIPPDATVFLFAGKFEPKKRLLDFVAAGAAARKAGARLHLLAVGAGPLESAARELAERSSSPVSFAGFLNQSEMPSAYAAADVLVLPSDEEETWGLVVNEGMACGLPAIVSDRVGCAPDLVEPDRTGAVFPLGDVDALARTMAAFAADPVRRAEMGENARRKANAYSVDHCVAGTVAAARAVSGV